MPATFKFDNDKNPKQIIATIDLCEAYTTTDAKTSLPKNTVIATTSGNIDTALRLKGLAVKMGTTFYIKGNQLDALKAK